VFNASEYINVPRFSETIWNYRELELFSVAYVDWGLRRGALLARKTAIAALALSLAPRLAKE
jgi:hypothetical protein